MKGRPNLQERVRHDDDADWHGGLRIDGVLGAVWHATGSSRWYGPWGTRWYLSRENTQEPKQASYTYVIERDGTIIRHAPPWFVAWHAGKKCTSAPRAWRIGESVNGRTIGICFVLQLGRAHRLTARQLESGLWLGSVMQEQHAYAPTENVAHREIAPTWKSDPMPEQLDMAHWRSLLALPEWPAEISSHPLEVFRAGKSSHHAM